MKKQFYLIVLSTILNFSYGQITFNKTVYHVNEDVIASGTTLVEGVDNDLTNASTIIAPGTASINLTKTATTGFYTITFHLTGGTKQVFLIEVLAAGVPYTGSLVFDLKYNSNKKSGLSDKFKKMGEFFANENKDVMLSVLSNGTKNFLKDKPISVIKNVGFCITIPSSGVMLPLVSAVCRSLTISNAKDLSREIFKELFSQMKNKGYLNPSDYSVVTTSIDLFANIGGMTEKDCSAFFDFAKDRIDNNDVKIAISTQGQLCSSTILIIKEYKKLP